MKFEEISDADFKTFATKYSKSFMQTKEFGDLLLSLSKERKVYYVGLKKRRATMLCSTSIIN